MHNAIRVQFARMKPGVEIKIHQDMGGYGKYGHRLHVPVTTHPDVRFDLCVVNDDADPQNPHSRLVNLQADSTAWSTVSSSHHPHAAALGAAAAGNAAIASAAGAHEDLGTRRRLLELEVQVKSLEEQPHDLQKQVEGVEKQHLDLEKQVEGAEEQHHDLQVQVGPGSAVGQQQQDARLQFLDTHYYDYRMRMDDSVNAHATGEITEGGGSSSKKAAAGTCYTIEAPEGLVFEVNNRVAHRVTNHSPVDRIHLVIDVMEDPRTQLQLLPGASCSYVSGFVRCSESAAEGVQSAEQVH